MKGLMIGMIAVLGFCGKSFAYESLDLLNDASFARELNLTQFSRADIISFSETRNGASMVRLVTKESNGNDGQESIIYKARILSASSGPTIAFKTRESCREGNSFETVIRIKEQNVKVLSDCGRDDGGDLANVFIILTDAGRDYTVRQFKDRNYVPVQFQDRIIPFSATGFREAWDDFGQPAL
ncbi:hypothetical protein ACR80S_13425 [Halomonas sp. MA07-2]|uniref:hypothetical protein n=1 Tax=Halomonas sp. MA07-2 TaxID=3440841 RepID=UPI003EEEEFD7